MVFSVMVKSNLIWYYAYGLTLEKHWQVRTDKKKTVDPQGKVGADWKGNLTTAMRCYTKLEMWTGPHRRINVENGDKTWKS